MIVRRLLTVVLSAGLLAVALPVAALPVAAQIAPPDGPAGQQLLPVGADSPSAVSDLVSTNAELVVQEPGLPVEPPVEWDESDEAVEFVKGKPSAVANGRLRVKVSGKDGNGDGPDGVTASVHLFSPKKARAEGFEHVAFRLDRTDFADEDVLAEVQIDLRGFEHAYGGDWLTRLQLLEFKGCDIGKGNGVCKDAETEVHPVQVNLDTLAATVLLPLLSAKNQEKADRERAENPKTPKVEQETASVSKGPKEAEVTPTVTGGRGRMVLPRNGGGSFGSGGFMALLTLVWVRRRSDGWFVRGVVEG